MNTYEKRCLIFDNAFKFDPKYGSKVLSANQINSKLLDKIIKTYAQDMDDEKDSILGIYDVRRNPKGKRGILFAENKMYVNVKKARNKKIWYDEIVKIKIKFPNKRKILIKTDEGKKVVIKTNRRLSRKTVDFILDIIEYNGEISKIEYDVEYMKMADNSLADYTGIEVARQQIVNTGIVEEKFHAVQGHGFAAERANNMIDRLQGKNATVIGDNNAKNGADRYIKKLGGNIEYIQTKYCKTATDSINACFDKNGQFRYYSDLKQSKPMSIEVPKDQYDEAINVFKNKIADGKVKGVTNPDEAKNIIKKGNIKYNQARNIAKAGNIESITYDAINGAVVSASAFGLSAIVSLATSVWNGDEVDVALKNATTTGMRVGGASFVTSVMASQLSKAGLNSALRSSTEALTKSLGSKTSAAIANAFRGSAAKQIYGAAAMKSAAKILRTNIITSIVMIIVFSIGDFINLLRRRITFGQFIKNFIVLALSIVAGVFGGLLGGVVGSIILPGFGTTVLSLLFAIFAGALTSFLGKKLLGLFLKEDADKMIKIIEEQFRDVAEEYLLNSIEQEKVIDKLTLKLDVKALRKMVASKDKEEYAREKLLIPITENQVKKRKFIVEPPIEVMIKTMSKVVQECVEE
ncbi:MAG: hypothetical protein IKS56_03305 [Lachnospiraceae bacterium]|nr:hypothetical protein [Lachnospiraceae bacterium]